MQNINYRIKQLLLLFGDGMIFFCGTVIALLIRRGTLTDILELQDALHSFGILMFFWIVVHYINGVYDIGKHKTPKLLFTRLFQAACTNAVIGVMFFYLSPQYTFSPKTILFLTILVSYILLVFWRYAFSLFFATKTLSSHILFVGHTPEMEELATILSEQPERGYTLVAWITPEQYGLKQRFPKTTFYSSVTAIRPSITVHAIHDVIIASEMRNDTAVRRELYELLFWKVNIRSLTSLYEVLTGRIPPYTFSESWFLDHLQHTAHPVYERTHRFFDISIGVCMYISFIILYPFVALAIRLDSPGSAIFKQERVGLCGTPFFLYKFRSMYALAKDGSAEIDGAQFAIKDDKRITRVGTFLRKIRLDELPQAINLIKGDISLIGPRPERPDIVHALETTMPYYPVRHIIKPGITGWAQVNQHYTDTLEQSLQKLQYDLYYIKNRSLVLDLSIILKTVNVVMRGMGQ